MAWMQRSMVACRSTQYRSWSLVQQEILDLVLQKLPHSDCLNFGRVCCSWRSVFLDRRRISRPPPCILQIPKHGEIPLQLWCLDGDQVARLLTPKPKLLLDLPAEMIVGSSSDWLVIIYGVWVGSYSEIHVINPISGEQIQLSSVATGGVLMHRFPCKHVLTVAYFRVQRIVMSSRPTSGDCIFVAEVSYRPANYHTDRIRRLAWCRPRDCEWTILTFQPQDLLLDTCDSVFHNGELYVLRNNGAVLACTFNPEPQITIRLPVTSVCDVNPVYKRLVVSGEEVLLVLQMFVTELHVFREQGGKWLGVKNLGDRVLLIGKHGGESLCTKDLMGSKFEPNCIYYEISCQLLGKYCMADKSHQRIPIPCSSENNLALELQWIVTQGW